MIQIAFLGADGIDSFTKLMLHFEGADAATAFPDSSYSVHTQTAAGNAQVDTAQFKFGSASGLFDGSGDKITTDSHVDFAMASGDFSIDHWVRFNSVSGTQVILDLGSGQPQLSLQSSKFVFGNANIVNRITGGTTIVTNTWYHLAVARSGSNVKMFLNGTQEGSTYAVNDTYSSSAQVCTIGQQFNGSASLNAWLDELRVSKGIARWTANFTSPTRPYS